MISADDRASLINKIRDLPARLEAVVRPLTDRQLTAMVPSDAWSIAQHVHHIADSHMNSLIRIKLILTEERPVLKPYDQDAWVRLADELAPPIGPSMAILEGLHQRWVRLWESLSETDWERQGLHPEVGVVTVVDLLQTYADHGDSHLAQINAILAAQDEVLPVAAEADGKHL